MVPYFHMVLFCNINDGDFMQYVYTICTLKIYQNDKENLYLPLTFKSLDKTLENIFKITNEILQQHCTSLMMNIQQGPLFSKVFITHSKFAEHFQASSNMF